MGARSGPQTIVPTTAAVTSVAASSAALSLGAAGVAAAILLAGAGRALVALTLAWRTCFADLAGRPKPTPPTDRNRPRPAVSMGQES